MRTALAIALLLLTAPAWADPPAVTITPVRAPRTVFGGGETEYRYRVEAKRPVRGRVAWRFVVGRATAAAREVELAAGPDKLAEVVIRLTAPPVRDGVVLAGRLTVSAFEGGAARAEAVAETDVWVFPRDPFADRRDWLKKLRVRLYDPPQATAKVLTALTVPFDEVHNPAAFAELKGGVLLIGEGVSFREERGLTDALAKLTAGGVTVLVLAPADGRVSIPGIGGPADGLRDLSFRRDLIRRLDKRFDADFGTAIRSVVVKPGESGAVGEVAAGPAGWPWVEARAEGGRWAFCGYPVVARWDDGPTSRFLFARLLEYLTDPGSELPKKGD